MEQVTHAYACVCAHTVKLGTGDISECDVMDLDCPRPQSGLDSHNTHKHTHTRTPLNAQIYKKKKLISSLSAVEVVRQFCKS